MRRTVILVILDGWGIGRLDESNPIHIAQLKTINYIQANFPAGALQASGIAVGLPWEEEGNSEVGHLTIGAGKILYQYFPRISISIDNGSFFENPTFKKVFAHAKNNNSSVHLVGLLTSGNVHASIKSLIALLEMAKKEGCQNLYLQLFADGKDSPPKSVLPLYQKLQLEIDKAGVGKIASIIGRYYGMERDGHWDRTEKSYNLLTDPKTPPSTIEEVAKNSYDNDLIDEFIGPSVIKEAHPIQENDAVIFFNFREDSMRQITETFLNPDFEKFPVKKYGNLFIATMSEYEEKFKTDVAFPREIVEKNLGKVISENKKTQLRVAETEKYAHVTYFFNSLNERPYPEEYRILVPSKSVLRHDEYPEMMASAITDRALIAINEGGFDFVLINYANSDIVAHTGNFDATVKAVKTIDREIERLAKNVLGLNHIMIITSDHGNAEELVNPQTGEIETRHDPNPVPFYLIGNEFRGERKSQESPNKLQIIGLLSDVAPTILALMKIPKPPEMTGQSLLDQLI